MVTVAAVDPGSYRRFTPAPAAQAQDVWTRVAGGELAVMPRLGRRLVDAEGFVRLGNDRTAPRVHVGALAPQIPRVDAVVNDAWASELGMRCRQRTVGVDRAPYRPPGGTPQDRAGGRV